jgi:hypothetical protein
MLAAGGMVLVAPLDEDDEPLELEPLELELLLDDPLLDDPDELLLLDDDAPLELPPDDVLEPPLELLDETTSVQAPPLTGQLYALPFHVTGPVIWTVTSGAVNCA